MTDLFQRLIAFMREADEWGTPADVLRSAEDAGLAIVSEADRKVIEACAAAKSQSLEAWADADTKRHWIKTIAKAELEARKTRAK